MSFSDIDPQNLQNIEQKIVGIARQAIGQTHMGGPGDFIQDGNGSHTPANFCEAFAETAASMATGIRIRFSSAETHYQSLLSAGKIQTDDNPPEGVFVFYHWNGDAFGHITVSSGNGNTIGTVISPDAILELPLHHYTGYAGWATPEAALQAAANMPPADPTGGGLGRRNGNYRSFSWIHDDNSNPMVIGNAFLDFWEKNGPVAGITQYGYPMSQEQQETNTKNITLTMQWFERTRIEFHPENQDPYRVEMGRLGAELLDWWIANGCTILNNVKINPTTDALDSRFINYFNSNGGIETLGIPLTSVTKVPGNDFESQVLERCILEVHLESADWPVQARRIGAEIRDLRKQAHGPDISG